MKNKFFYAVFFICFFFIPCPAAFSAEKEDWDFANGLYVRKIYDLSQKEYKRFIESYPKSPFINDAYYRIAESLWNLKRYEEAIPYYQKLKREDISESKNEVIRLREALCYRETNDSVKARDLLQEFEKEFPESPIIETVYYLLGQMESSLDNDEKALEYYDKAIAEDGENARISHYRKGHVLLRLNRKEEALQAFLDLRKNEKSDQIDEDALFKTGEIYFQMQDFSKAFESYQSFLKRYPDSELALEAYKNVFYSLSRMEDLDEMERYYNATKATLKYEEARELSLFVLAKTAYAKGRYSLSQGYCEKLKTEGAGSAFFVQSLVLSARIAFAQKKYDDVFVLLDETKGSELTKEELCEISFIRAQSLKELGRISEAQELFHKVIRIGCETPLFSKAYFESADCLTRLGHYEEAAATMESFIKSQTDSEYLDEACLKYAEYLSYSGKLEEAVNQLKIFIRDFSSSPKAVDATYRMGINLMKMNRYDEMAEVFQEFVENYPDDEDYRPKAYYWMGWNELRKGEYKKSKDILEVIYKNFRDQDIFPDAVYWMGVASYSLGQNKDAMYYFIENLDIGHKEIFSASLLFWLADELIKNSDYPHAETALSWLKEKVVSLEDIQKVMFLDICLAVGKKDYERAIRASEEFLDKYPESLFNFDVELKLIDALIGKGVYEKAESRIARLVQEEDVDISFRASYKKAEILERKGNKEEAAREYLRLAILYDHPLCPSAAYRAYEIFLDLGQEEAMQKSKKEILDRWPDSQQAKEFQDE
ncbi:MAG: tetratricopeptide repeat protein [Candidatus Aureabacteria bacterium]|nr:tetratricopeptide repeat protein [Candidatus Auribacterota bacterium]